MGEENNQSLPNNDEYTNNQPPVVCVHWNYKSVVYITLLVSVYACVYVEIIEIVCLCIQTTTIMIGQLYNRQQESSIKTRKQNNNNNRCEQRMVVFCFFLLQLFFMFLFCFLRNTCSFFFIVSFFSWLYGVRVCVFVWFRSVADRQR